MTTTKSGPLPCIPKSQPAYGVLKPTRITRPTERGGARDRDSPAGVGGRGGEPSGRPVVVEAGEPHAERRRRRRRKRRARTVEKLAR